MSDIAKKVGVSTVTVSKALAGKDGVSAELRARIKETAQEMGYQQAASPHRSHRGDAGNIGILIPVCFIQQNMNSFYWELYEEVVSRLLLNSCYGILELLSEETVQNLTLPRILQDGKTDGLVVIGQVGERYRRMLMKQAAIPMVFLDSYDSCGSGYSVISDGYYGMYFVTNFLLSLGHRDIHFVGTISSTSSISDRYFGYCRAMTEHGIAVTDGMVLPDRDEHGNIRFHVPDTLPTAFVCNCDLTAYEVIDQLKTRGLRVPDDVSVAGFDHFSVPYHTVPALTTYAVDMPAMARVCVDSLLHQIRHKRPLNDGIKVVSGKLIIGNSVKNVGS